MEEKACWRKKRRKRKKYSSIFSKLLLSKSYIPEVKAGEAED